MRRVIEEQAQAFGWHKPAEVMQVLRDAYLKIHSLKADFDRMEEIPSYLSPAYSAVLKAAGDIGKAQDSAQEVDNQLRHARKTVR
jgi:hypothetical protein